MQTQNIDAKKFIVAASPGMSIYGRNKLDGGDWETSFFIQEEKAYINKLDIVRSVMDNGTGKAETANEHILIKLMQLRGTPMTSFEFEQKRVDFYYNQWKNEKTS
jgi:hypothetical protein